jgi:hypothetical protein
MKSENYVSLISPHPTPSTLLRAGLSLWACLLHVSRLALNSYLSDDEQLSIPQNREMHLARHSFCNDR